MKKIIKFLHCLVICVLTLSFTINSSYALNVEQQQIQISEYDMYRKLKSSTIEELKEMGLSSEEIEQVSQLDLYSELKKRASYSNDVLYALGYTDEMINELRNAINRKTVDEEMLMNSTRAAVLTLNVNTPTCSQTKYIFNYNFVWSSCPIFIKKDIVALCWAASSSNGSPLNVRINETQSYLKVVYTKTGNATALPTSSLKYSINNSYSSAYREVDMGYNYGDGDSTWLKKGEGKVQLEAAGSGKIQELFFKIAYGHNQLFLTSTGVDFTGTGFSIGFTFEFGVNEEDEWHAVYDYKGNKK